MVTTLFALKRISYVEIYDSMNIWTQFSYCNDFILV